MEMGAPQLRHFPRRYSQGTSGTFRYQGMEYWQCGQWEGGDTMLWPRSVAGRDGRAAVAALPAQIQPGDQRDVKIPGDGVLAVRTMGRGRHDALAQRHPVNAHVEEAPDDGAEHKEHQRPEVE